MFFFLYLSLPFSSLGPGAERRVPVRAKVLEAHLTGC